MTLLLALAAVSALPTVPGAANPAVTQTTIDQTICSKAKDAHGHTWIHNQRPSASYTTRLKLQQMKALGLTGNPRLLEEDHRLPIEVGGNPTDPANIGPEPWNVMASFPAGAMPADWGAHTKDRLENYVHRSVCSGTMTLSQGQAVFLGDWTAEHLKVFGEPGAPHGERG